MSDFCIYVDLFASVTGITSNKRINHFRNTATLKFSIF